MKKIIKEFLPLIISAALVIEFAIFGIVMPKRLMQFLPSLTVFMIINAVLGIYLVIMIKLWQKNLKSIEWAAANTRKVFFLIGIPAENIYAPVTEELIYRAPLIILFAGISKNAWLGIFITTTLFAVSHYFGRKVNFLEILSSKHDDKTDTDNIQEAAENIEIKQPQIIKLRRWLHVLVAFLAGILISYCGVRFQSILLSIGIHFVWNLVMPTIILLTIIITVLVHDLWDEFKWRYIK